MAVQRFGVDAARVLGDLPSNTRGVSSSSAGLSTTQIETWIGEAAGKVQAQLESHGVDVAAAAVDGTASREVAAAAIVAYATAKALAKGANGSDPRIADAWTVWRESLDALRATPNDIGEQQPVRVISNVQVPRERRLTFRDERW